ncbi:SDR family oxidoreductase [soil metagenome]
MAVTIDLFGSVVLVTGASGGIGAGIARRFAAAGATVAAHFRTGARAGADLVSNLDDADVFAADLAQPGSAEALVDDVVARFGRLDVLVNNAGIQPLADLADMDDEAWTSMIDTNLTAVHRLSQAAARVMGDGCSITHIASIEGSHPAAGHGHYAVSKAGLIMHGRAAALEWGSRGIRVNTISPGLIARPGIEDQWPEGVERWRAAAPLRRLGTPEDIGDACVFLASELARWVTGAELVVDGGVSTHPTW